MKTYKIDFVGVITDRPRISWETGLELPTVNAMSIKKQLKDLGVERGDTVELQMHCFGGDVQEGHYIMSLFEDAGIILDVNVLGCAYSEATYFVGKSNKARMSNNGHFMIHNVRGGNYGTAEELKSTAKDIEDYDNLLSDVLAKKSKKTQAEIKEKYLDGKSDKGLTAQEALDAGFIDEIYGLVDSSFQNKGYSKFVNSFFDMTDMDSKNNYFAKIQTNLSETTMKDKLKTPQNEGEPKDAPITQAMLAVMAEKENSLRSQVTDLENRLLAIQNEKETAAKKFADLLQDKDTEIVANLASINSLTQEKSKLLDEVKEGKVVNKVFAAIASMRKNNGLPLTEQEVDKFRNGFLTMYKVDEVNGNFVATSKITQEVQKNTLWDCVQSFCKDQNTKLFHVQNGNGHGTTQQAVNYETKTRETLFAEAKQLAMTKYNAGSDLYYSFLINLGFKDELPLNVIQRLT